MPSEFDLIRRHFVRPGRPMARTLLGPGDDAALLKPEAGMALAVSTDMLVEGRHFARGCDPRSVGHKSLAVNLSDLAAVGATPVWATLALALPEADEAWLSAFSAGLFALADRHQVDLVGGDLTRGPRCISITVGGEVPEELSLLRGGACPGDEVWVSGELGGASLSIVAAAHDGIALSAAERLAVDARLDRPEPRVTLGERLRGIASAAIDVSDGFAQDLSHLLERSGVAARIDYDRLPRAGALACIADRALEARCVLGGGDDYELVFCAPPAKRAQVAALAGELDLPLTAVGVILPASDAAPLEIVDSRGRAVPVPRGFDHFDASGP